MESDTFKLGLTDGTTTLAVTTTAPTWGGTGTDLEAEEVSGGNYDAGGKALANPSAVLTGGLIEIDMDDPAVWSSNASNPADATYGVIYNDQANKEAVGFVDLGGAFDMTTGDLTVVWGAPMATINQA